MKTTAIYISTLCVPCENRCRYCLLSWDGKLLGADYDRSQRYAEGFYNWLTKNRPDVSFQFYYGYSMEHPSLTDAIAFAAKTGSAGGSFLQVNGLKFREDNEIAEWFQTAKACGIQSVDFTFYGTQAYHDRFSARKGDFDYMLRMLKTANKTGVQASASIPITNENAAQMEDLLDILNAYEITRTRIFVPHREGRGVSLEDVRLTETTMNRLSPRIRSLINLNRYKSERQWVNENHFETPEKRVLAISLTPENIGAFEVMSYADAIAYLEKLDDDYYSIMPSIEALVKLYGDRESEKIFDQRDLLMYYQDRYIKENNLKVYDINDERQCFSRRY